MGRLDATCVRVSSLAATDCLRVAITLVLIGLLSANTLAVTTNWTNNSGGSFIVSGNWDNGVPDANDTAVFRRGNVPQYDVSFFSPNPFPIGSAIHPTVNRLIVGTNPVNFLFPFLASSLTVEAVSRGSLLTGGDMIIGQTASDVAVLNMNLANLMVDEATLGSAAGSSGTLNLNGSRTFNVTGATGEFYDLKVGDGGTGIINVSGGADVTVSDGVWLGAHGTVTVSGTGSTWNCGIFDPGDGGTFNVNSGGTLSTGSVFLYGTVNVTGANSSWTSGEIRSYGGTLNISNGGHVSASTAFTFNGDGGGGSVNVSTGGTLSTGPQQLVSITQLHRGVHVSVTGADSVWTNFGELDVSIGASISISDSGRFQNHFDDTHVSLGGQVTVQGAGSRWANDDGRTLFVDSGGTLTVTNGGTVYGIVLINGGTVTGNGDISSVSNGGIVAPGDSLGALHVGGYSQSASGNLQIELGGTTPNSEYDQLLVTSMATLHGTLEVALVNGFVPNVGQTFTILTTSNVFGTFDTGIFPPLSNRGFDVIYNATSVVLKVILPGDFDFNGVVDAADYILWRKTGGTAAGYNAWRTHFGQSAGSGSGAIANAAVPEPTTLVLILVGTLALLSLRRDTVS